jgi:predicted metalloprotease with PDZ domain
MIKPTRSWLALVLLGTVCLESSGLRGQEGAVSGTHPSTIRYTISLAGFQDHLLHIRMDLPVGDAVRQVQLPVWNALYQVRDFSQHVKKVGATRRMGEGLAIEKIDKTTWQLEGAKDGATVDYEVFADQPGPYGVQVNANHAFLNLAEILMYPVGGRSDEIRLRFTGTPPDWKFATPLAIAGDEFTAANYDQLVDSPVEIGTFQEADFDEGGGHYRVVVDADRSDYDMVKIVADAHRIVAAATGWMNDRPFQEYLFFYHFPRGPGGGGMEHAYSTAIELNAQDVKDNPQSLDDVTAHEFFHLWNVKRIRPQTLEPIDYTKENYTRVLWFSEGVTSTVEDIILLRAGLLDERGYLNRIGQQISELQRRPAHLTQSAEESSLDAWLEKYPYYRQPERSISYYNKGELLGVVLDLAVRDASQGTASLREVFHWMNRNFAKQGRFFADSAGVRQAAEAVSHSDLTNFFQKFVAGVAEIPWDEFFATVGLHVVRKTVRVADPGFTAARNFDASPSVIRVRSGSDAERAGLAVGDVLLEINGMVAAGDFERRLGELRPGEMIHLRVRNARGEHALQWRVGAREEVECALKDVDNTTAQQKARRAAWLRGESQPAGDARP